MSQYWVFGGSSKVRVRIGVKVGGSGLSGSWERMYMGLNSIPFNQSPKPWTLNLLARRP